MASDRPNPAVLMQLATGYWSSAAFLAACSLRVFDALAASPATAGDVALWLGADPRATEMLLDACVGMALLVKEGGDRATYVNTPECAAFLVSGRPGYLGDAIAWSAEQFTAWGGLTESVRTGTPAAAPALHLGENEEQTRRFVLGMHSRALGVARGLVPLLDFEGVSDLLDVGGGSGAYAMLIAERHPDIRVTVLDLPGVIPITGEIVARAGMAERVRLMAGDALAGDYGEAAYGGVLFSGVLHQMAPSQIARMLAGAHRALAPGGRIVISDMMLDREKTGPVFSALFSLQMLLTTECGAVFSAEECREWLQGAGFAEISIQGAPPPLPYTVAAGRKR